MEEGELEDSARRLVEELAESSPGQPWGSVLHLLDYGQDDEALDVLIATIVRFNVPVTAGQRRTLEQLMNEFEFTALNRRNYRYLSDSEMLDRMVVRNEIDPP